MEEKTEQFTFRLTEAERKLLDKLAQRLERNQSDTLRLLIRQAAEEKNIKAGK